MTATVLAEQVTVTRRGNTLILSDGVNPDVSVRIGR